MNRDSLNIYVVVVHNEGICCLLTSKRFFLRFIERIGSVNCVRVDLLVKMLSSTRRMMMDGGDTWQWRVIMTYDDDDVVSVYQGMTEYIALDTPRVIANLITALYRAKTFLGQQIKLDLGGRACHLRVSDVL